VTLNDHERCNGRVVCVISSNSVYFRAHYVIKVVEDTRYTDTFCNRNVARRMYFLAIYHLWRYSQGIASSEGVNVRHSLPLAKA